VANILRTLSVREAALETRPAQASWTGYAAWGTRLTGT
jgi:hypothetical protein